MALTLYIRPKEDLGAPVEWLVSGSGQVIVSKGQSDLSGIDTRQPFSSVVVLVPGICVSLFEVDIPTRNRAQLLRAVPFAVEEEIAGDVEDLHFAVEPGANGKSIAVAIDRAWFEQLLDRLDEVGIRPQSVVPDTLCLPWADGSPSMLLEDDRYSVRSGAWSCYSLEAPYLDIELMSPMIEEGVSWRIFDARSETSESIPLLSENVESREEIDSPLALLARQYSAVKALNLLQGDFSEPSAWTDAWSKWRLAGVLVALIGTVYLGGLAVEIRQLSEERAFLKQEMTEVFKSTFPDAVRVIDPAVQMRNRLKVLRGQSGGGASGFLDLIGSAGKLIVADNKVTISLMRFKNGRLELDLQADSIERLEAVELKLKEANFDAELKSARNDGGRFQARVILGREGAS